LPYALIMVGFTIFLIYVPSVATWLPQRM